MEHLSDEMTLCVGCGPRRGEPAFPQTTEIGIDIRPDVRPDVVGDMRALPFKDGCFFGVVASHVLEHIPIWDTELSLREMRRVLIPRGALQVNVPDLGWIAEQIVRDRLTPHLIPMIYGAPGKTGWNHLMGFDASLLVGYIRLAGFRETEVASREIGMAFWGADNPRHEGEPLRTDKFRELRIKARKK